MEGRWYTSQDYVSPVFVCLARKLKSGFAFVYVCVTVPHRVVPLRLCGPDRSPQRQVVLSPVYSRHEEEGQPAQISPVATVTASPGPSTACSRNRPPLSSQLCQRQPRNSGVGKGDFIRCLYTVKQLLLCVFCVKES